MGNQVRDAGTVSIDTGAVLIIDPMYLMTDADHDAGRTPEELAPTYDAVHVDTRRDGVFPVTVEYGDDGSPVGIRINLRP